jgi:hypothetical protein
MKFNSFLGGCLTTIAVVGATAFFYNQCHQSSVTTQVEKTTDVKVDTVIRFIDAPIPKDSLVLRYETVKVPVNDTTYISAEHAFPDTLTVSIPITQKIYQDSTYQAWVSGYKSSLDSIKIYQPVTTITNTVTNTAVQYKTKRWGVGVQVGLGVTPSKIEPYIGVGVTYNIFSW